MIDDIDLDEYLGRLILCCPYVGVLICTMYMVCFYVCCISRRLLSSSFSLQIILLIITTTIIIIITSCLLLVHWFLCSNLMHCSIDWLIDWLIDFLVLIWFLFFLICLANTEWTCDQCTLINNGIHQACLACDAPRGYNTWSYDTWSYDTWSDDTWWSSQSALSVVWLSAWSGSLCLCHVSSCLVIIDEGTGYSSKLSKGQEVGSAHSSIIKSMI